LPRQRIAAMPRIGRGYGRGAPAGARRREGEARNGSQLRGLPGRPSLPPAPCSAWIILALAVLPGRIDRGRRIRANAGSGGPDVGRGCRPRAGSCVGTPPRPRVTAVTRRSPSSGPGSCGRGVIRSCRLQFRRDVAWRGRTLPSPLDREVLSACWCPGGGAADHRSLGVPAGRATSAPRIAALSGRQRQAAQDPGSNCCRRRGVVVRGAHLHCMPGYRGSRWCRSHADVR